MDACQRSESDSTGEVTDTPPRSYSERKLTGWCTYGACPRRAEGWPDPRYQFCQRHRTKVNRKKAKRQAEQRASLAESGKCIRCRKPSETYRCPACRILDQTPLPSARVTAGEVTLDPWRRDNDGWQRYRGKGRRGAPEQSVTDDDDLATALASLERGRQALAYAHSPPVKARSREAHRDARAAAASILLMAAGFLREVATRNMPTDTEAVSLRGRVKEALGEGVDPEMLDDAMIDRVIQAVRSGADAQAARGRR